MAAVSLHGVSKTVSSGSQEEVDLGRDGLAAGGGEVAFLDGRVDHAAPHRLHHVAAAAAAPLAELRAHAALHVAAAQRQEGNEAGDEPLLDDAGLKEPTWRAKRHFSVFKTNPLSNNKKLLKCFLWFEGKQIICNKIKILQANYDQLLHNNFYNK